MEEIREATFRAMAQAFDELFLAGNRDAVADASSKLKRCIKILNDIGIPLYPEVAKLSDKTWAGLCATETDIFVIKTYRMAGPAARAKILDILKNHAFE